MTRHEGEIGSVGDEVRDNPVRVTQQAALAGGNGSSHTDPTSLAVARIWSSVLQRDGIGATENFFDLGGDSLKALEVISGLRELLNVELPLIAFFEEPTIAHLSEVIEELRQSQDARSEQEAGRNGNEPVATQEVAEPAKTTASPVTSTVNAIARIWRELLHVENIGLTQNFFDLGGDSLKAMEVISGLRELLNVELPLIAFFEEPTIAHLAEVIGELTHSSQASPAGEAGGISEGPLSYPELTFWLLQQQDPESCLYHQTRVLRVRGKLQPDVLERTLNEIYNRHDVLRARFVPGSDGVVQVIAPRGGLRLEFQDLCSAAIAEREALAFDIAREERRKPFDLSAGPIIRARLLRLGDNDHLLVIVNHHLVGDGHSAAIFFDELSAIYRAFAAGLPNPLPPLAMQYPEYAAAERSRMHPQRLQSELQYWRDHLKGAPYTLDLPTDRPWPQDPRHAGNACSVAIPAELVDGLEVRARSQGATLFTELMAALRILLYRWTAQADIVVATVASNRSRAETHPMFGCFLNFLPLRNKVTAEETVSDVVNREKRVVMDGFAHQECPFVEIVPAVSSARVGDSNPIYNVALLLQDFPQMKFSGDSFEATFVELPTESALLDLRFLARERQGQLELSCEFNTALFEASTIECLLNGFVAVLHILAAGSDIRVSDIGIPAQLAEQAAAVWKREQKQTIAITATFTAEPLEDSLAFWMRQLKTPARIEFAPYNQVFQQVLDPASLLGKNTDGINVVLLRMGDWQRFERQGPSWEQSLTQNVDELCSAIKTAVQCSSAPYILCVCPPPQSLDAEKAGLLLNMEARLAAGLSNTPGVHVLTAAQVLERYPVANYDDPYADQIGHIPYTPEFFTALGSAIARRIHSLRRAPHKVIVLDCDNTLWRGTCGEDGPLSVQIDGPRRALQEFMITQSEAGMIVCLCSKNAEEDVFAVFENNPAMVLRREHITARRINWRAKSENLRELAAELQLGLDSFIFVDDNPLECADVQANCPEVLTLQLPARTEQIPQFLGQVWAFDHWTVTEEDKKRAQLYRQNAEREQLRSRAASVEDFLASLELNVDISPMNREDLARVSQLTERTNQFNLTTRRRSEGEIEKLCQSGSECLVVRVRDRFGDYGLVGVVLFSAGGEALQVDTFLLSCRALGRKVEHQILAKLGAIAQQRGLRRVEVPFVPTRRNQPAADFVEGIAGQFSHSIGGQKCYRIPSEYAAKAVSLKPAEVALPSETTTEKPVSVQAADTEVLARIAAELATVDQVQRAIESQKRIPTAVNTGYVAPRTPTEEMLAGIWTSLLRMEKVGVHDNFFSLGGHSLLATQMVARIRQVLSVEVPLRAVFEMPSISQLAAYIETRAGDSGPRIPPLARCARPANMPLSFAQQRLWFLEQLEPGNPLYNVSQMIRMRGSLNVEALQASLNEIVRRHEVLRTRFEIVDNVPVQIIAAELQLIVPVTDLSQLPASQRESHALRTAKEEASAAFDLSRGPLLRARILRLGAEDHLLLLSMHHAISDRWSMGVLAEELAALYPVVLSGKASTLAELPVQYADYALWQREWLQGEALERQVEYWKEKLAGSPPVLELPSDRPRPAVQSYRGANQILLLSKELVDRLAALSRTEGVTLFMTLLAAFQTLLSRYSGQEEIVVGSPIANRRYAEAEKLIGFFVNTLALRGDLSGDPTFRELLSRVKEACLGAYAHQDIPFEKLVEELQPQRSLSYNPIFQVMFALQNAPMQAIQLPGLVLERGPIYTDTAMFDMSWFAIESAEGLLLRVEYNTDLFEESTVRRVLGHFDNLLQGIVSSPQSRLSELPLLSEAEQHQVLVQFNDSASDYRRVLCLHQLFERQVEVTPDVTAATFGEQSLTYAELNTRANQLAHYLRKRGVGPEVLVGICVERSLNMLVGLLGILKAGGAYVPLDPAYPKERLGFILEDTRVTVLLTQQSLLDTLPQHAAEMVCLDADWGRIAAQLSDDPISDAEPANLAYVLFTSGSTGKPKGVQIEHRNVVNFLESMRRCPGFTAEDVLLAVTTLSFDIAGLELYLPLVCGGRVVIASREQAVDARQLSTLLASSQPTVMQATPATWRMLVDFGWPGSPKLKILCGGEALPADLAESLLPRCRELWNMYGPTETTIWSSLSRVSSVPSGTAPIGRPIANTAMYVLHRQHRPAPIGVSGELYIGGDGVARGYLNRPELTAERFVPDPFSREKDARMYRTGDLCRFLADGSVEYLGRMDHQIKLRGFRIELGEIEAVLAKHPGVQQCVVVAREDDPGMKRLVAYLIVKDGEFSAPETLTSYLRQNLPDYMIPSAFVTLSELPLTPNGKIDRKALPAPDFSEAPAYYIAPRNEVEDRLASIWAEVLRVAPISADADFFSIGGHSLLAAQVFSRLRQTFGIDLPLKTIFETPKLESLAARIQSTQRGLEIPSIARVSREKPLPASFTQQRLWFLDQLEPGTPAYNLPWTLRISGRVNAHAIENSLNAIAARQESLRTSFRMVDGQPFQIIHDSVRIPFRTVDCSALPEDKRVDETRRLIAEDANRPFDLSQAPLLRVLLVSVSEREHYLLLNIHHIVSDRWSLGVLSQELAAFYRAESEGAPAGLPELPLQYADYTAWQHEWLRGEVLSRGLAYWKDKLKDAPPVLELPTDHPRPATESCRGDVAYFSWPRALQEGLKELSRKHGATLFMVLLAGFQAVLSRWSGQDDLVIGTAIANRTHPDLEKVIGFFLNTLPLRTRMSGEPTFAEIISRVKETALEAYAHQEIPFEKLVEELKPERSLSHSPLVQVYFILQNAPMEGLQFGGLDLQPVASGIKTVKGDMYLSMHESVNGLEARLEYSTDLFEESTAERMLEHLGVLLEAAVKNPELKLSELPLLSVRERQQVLRGWNATHSEYPRELCLHELFEMQAERSPDAVACIQAGDKEGDDRQITYGELNQRANQLARALRKRGARPGERVAIFVERSLEMMIGLLAIQKSGAAYLPLDPAYPLERLRLTMEDAQATVLITQDSLRSKLPEHSAGILCLDSDWPAVAVESSENLGKTATPQDLVYVIFTSGSTGRPKGVQVPHRAVVNLLTFMGRVLEIGHTDVFPALASFAFDMCIPELYLALVCGGRTVIGRKDLAANGEELAELLRRTGATVVHATPTTWRLLQDSGFNGKGLKRVIGAEPVPQELCARLLMADSSLYNFYGPTETTVWSTYHHFVSLDEPVVVGRPIANTQVYILDGRLQPVPIGAYGEIYIGGDGVAHGYLNRPELTAEKFLHDPFSTQPGARIYRTGDMGRFLPDGRIEFQGRADYQVKVRGYRIEPGEIESVLGKHQGIEQAIVTAREDIPGGKRLVGYVVAKAGYAVNSGELRQWVRDRLPEYMVPSAWVQMSRLPLSPNGKVDRRNLPAPEHVELDETGTHPGPRTHEEEVIAGIWCEVLNLGRVGVQENFFELGGHSLLAMQVISRIRESFKVELPVRSLFEAPTVAGLIERVLAHARKQTGLEIRPLSRTARNRPLPLSFAQQRLWFLDQLEPGNPLYNVAYVTRLKGRLDLEALEQSLNEIVRRHESLRTVFQSLDDQPVQVITPQLQLKINVLDVRSLPTAAARESEARKAATAEMQRRFDLAVGPLIRASLIRIGQDDHALILNTHHIISDRWSLGVLSQELAKLYEAQVKKDPLSLPDLKIQYADYAVWQREVLSDEVLSHQLAYWRNQLEGAPAVLELPTDRPRKNVTQYWGAQHRQPIPAELVRELRAFSRAQHGTFSMTLLAGFELLLARLTSQDDLLVGTDLANRNQLETEKLIGFFVNLLPMRARLNHDSSFTEFFQQVRETSLEALTHQEIPFDKLVEELQPERDLSHNPLVQVLFVMQNTPQLASEFAGLKLEPLGVSSSSRFDLVMFVNDPEHVPWIMWSYNPGLLDATTVARMANLYQAVLEKLAADPQIRLGALLDWLGEVERQQRAAEQQEFQAASVQKLKKLKRRAMTPS